MLTWYDIPSKKQRGAAGRVSYKAHIPHWGKAKIHPHSRHPGEMFLDCPGLGIKMHPLGHVAALDALTPAEKVLLKTLEQHGNWCLEAMTAIGSPES